MIPVTPEVSRRTLSLWTAAPVAYYNVNDSNYTSTSTDATTTQGLWLENLNSSTVYLDKNGSNVVSNASGGTALINRNVYVFAQDSSGSAGGFTADQLATFFLGGGLTPTQRADLAARLNSYMTAWGVNVFSSGSSPVISNISSGSPTTTAATITWTTNENATSKVAYGTTTAYGSATSSASLVTSHSLVVTGLASATTYHYAVVSADGQGNTATSTDQTFTTPSGDTTPPSTPTGLTATATSSSEIDLSWTASNDNGGGDAVTGYQVFRGGSQIATSTQTTYADTGLAASTTYTYVVKAFDAAGNVSASSTSATATTYSLTHLAHKQRPTSPVHQG